MEIFFPQQLKTGSPPIQTGCSKEYEVEYVHEESTWEPLSKVGNAKEAVQLYLDKKNLKEGFPGKEGDGVRIDNSYTLETRAQEQESNPGPEYPQAARPGDQGTTCQSFSGVKPPQAEAKNDGPNGEASQIKGIIAQNGGLIKAPNGSNKILTISFMSLNSTLVANQEPSLEEGMGPQPNPMTTTLEQDNQVANLRSLINERTPSLGAIL
ncbi:hypothetical protein DSO57_1035846 [Entomophthora muscae]|uniref:Uncharacterized protein n=1 Tax=Entomophthora muscae TaxID=34485 RepID=A0ACC2RE78_9FUNG|nr:hypothetical protein DSO57_1035846 [Entomophthora muscae]